MKANHNRRSVCLKLMQLYLICQRYKFESESQLTDLPYAAIHNDGGEIVVTAKMKRYFSAKFYESQGGFERKKGIAKRPLSDGGFYAWTSKMNLTPVAEFWRFMALKRAGTTIRIPRRRFLGAGPEVERIVREIIEENLNEYFNVDFSIERK